MSVPMVLIRKQPISSYVLLELRLSLLSIAPAKRERLGRGEGRTMSNAIGVAQMLKEVS